MIHIITIHWQIDYWINIQLKYIKQHINQPFKVYTLLTSNIYEKNKHKFFFAESSNEVQHSIKLDMLVNKIDNPLPDDILIFIDGDAFPIKNINPIRMLKNYPLVAVQRLENLGDIQPHPCFCVTTYNFWKKYNCTWIPGYRWKNINGCKITDVGGNLLKILIDNKLKWRKLLRTNKKNIHPLFFGIYGNSIYHHGAGFRSQSCRFDAYMETINKKTWNSPSLNKEVLKYIENDSFFYQKFI